MYYLLPQNDNFSLQELNDLSFRAGDIIEIVTETNADWWTGRLNGRQGLFPSTYVEKLDTWSSPPPTAPQYPVDERGASGPYKPQSPSAPVYQAPPPQPYQSGPPQAYNPYLGPPMQPAPQQQVVQQEQPPPQQSNKFGGLKQTVSLHAFIYQIF